MPMSKKRNPSEGVVKFLHVGKSAIKVEFETQHAVKLGRSAVTGKFVLTPAGKGGGRVSTERAREVMRNVLAPKRA